MRSATIIALRTQEANLKRKLRTHLKQIGFQRSADGALLPPNLDKASYRSIHANQRAAKFSANKEWIAGNSDFLIQYFASGTDVNVHAIRPCLELALGETWQANLFRFAGLYWQIPISEGYGRRLRFLVWDDSNGKLIGILALGDAVFNLQARDGVIGWDHRRRAEALVNIMDAYVLGAVPPYNALLGGKLIASLARTSDVVEAFEAKYHDSVGLISKRRKNARLVAITTTSALGRSSVYNRLKLDGRLIFEPIGYTSGWGHFHISDSLFEDLRDYLTRAGDKYASAFKFGQGPNWRLRVIRRALGLLGLDPNLIRHGFAREVFLCTIARNALPFLRGDQQRVRYGHLPNVASVSKLALERWVVPRAARMPEYLSWRSEQFLDEITTQIGQTHSNPESRRWIGHEIS